MIDDKHRLRLLYSNTAALEQARTMISKSSSLMEVEREEAERTDILEISLYSRKLTSNELTHQFQNSISHTQGSFQWLADMLSNGFV